MPAIFLHACCCLLLALLGACGDVRSTSATGADADFEPARAGPAASTLVVFVHGVLGDAVTTFGADREHNWPVLLASDPAFAGQLAVLSLGYRSAPLAGGSNVNEIANRLLVRLRDKDVFRRYRHVVFVAHSMGGLVVKRMLVQLQADAPSELGAVAAVFFIATPAGGADLADVSAWVSGNPQFRDMRGIDANTLLQAYEDDWQALLRARPSQRPYPRAFCVYETRATGPFHVVPRSRTQAGCDERPNAFEADHLGIVKPVRRDGVYEYVGARIRRVLAGDYLALQIHAQLTAADDTVLPPDLTLRSGQQFALRLHASKPAWFLVLAGDSAGKLVRLYPSALGGQQEVPAAQLRIPASAKEMLQLDHAVGVETIYVFASSASRLDLPQATAELARPRPGGTARLSDELRKRGLDIAPKRAAPAGAPRQVSFDAASIGAQAVLRVSIGHI
ncbi:DUF4384 domain-containing protein [Massilia sp. YMA4]|uniref:DUF7379 domain-containing protein n=1 Tax=Massilia sp. YMA4 TaxID=1593482 RepID=UPI000DD0F7EB|nr:DUF4384 domain-containing protein [Massilia sp. YMA4]AXA91235.1 hypothetical protein DPH57_08740 [Massilia sp. YMA4]